jgi:epoxyqueuosine reductase
MRADTAKRLAHECGFELCGVAAAAPVPESSYYHQWADAGFAGEMQYLTDRRAAVRDDPRNLLPSARSVICVGKLYDKPMPRSIEMTDAERAWISRYAWGADYHQVLRQGLEQLASRIPGPFEFKICVDTAPLLERAYARHAGLGWIAKNTCLINQQMGSWFFLGELLVSLDLEPDSPLADRCGSCTRCIEACPTDAIVPAEGPGWALDARLCISYHTIELRGEVPEAHRKDIGHHVFGCDICQDVCPWNQRSSYSGEAAFDAVHYAPSLEHLAAMSSVEFHWLFRHTPVERARYSGFLRNVAIAMGNSKLAKFRDPLERLAASIDPLVAEHARWALAQLEQNGEACPAV